MLSKLIPFISALVLKSSLVFSLYNGCPSLPEMPEQGFFSKDYFLSFKVGYEGDFLFGRKLKAQSISASNLSIDSTLHAASFTLGFVNRVEVYSLLGASRTTLFLDPSDQSNQSLHTGNTFAAEGGIRAILAFWREMKLGLDAKYFYAWPLQKEWQIGASLSQRFAFFLPYFGAKYAQFMQDFHSSSLGSFSVENSNPFGLFIGLGIGSQIGPLFDIEVRFLDDYALTASLGLSF